MNKNNQTRDTSIVVLEKQNRAHTERAWKRTNRYAESNAVVALWHCATNQLYTFSISKNTEQMSSCFARTFVPESFK